MDLILIKRQLHLRNLMMMHMITCCESMTRVFPYGCFLFLVFKEADIDLSRETNFEAPSIYDMYNDQFMGMMEFQKASDGSYIRKVDKAPSQAQTQTQAQAQAPVEPQGQGQGHLGVKDKVEIQQMEGGVNPQGGLDPQSDQQSEPKFNIHPLQTKIPSQIGDV